MFGNIDNILAVNEAFLHDLEQMGTSKVHNVGGIGDVALKHVRIDLPRPRVLNSIPYSSNNSRRSIATSSTTPRERKLKRF